MKLNLKKCKECLNLLFQHILFAALILVMILILTKNADAKGLSPKLPLHIRTVKCDESKMIDVFIKPSFTTIINFPIKPDNVILGSKNQFSVEYIKSDLAISSLNQNAKTNLFVYLFGRRCGFQLITTHANQDNLLLVRDPDEIKMKVLIK